MSQERSWMKIGAAIAVFFILLNIVSYVWFPFLPWTEQRQAGEEIVEQQMDAEKALENYRWFRSQYHDIEAQREQVENSYDELERFYEIQGKDPDDWSREAEVRHGRIQERITGNQNMLESMVAEYNARSDDATRSIFKCNLPYSVDDRFAITGPPGSDAPDQPQDEYVDGADPNKEPPKPEECDALPEEVNA